jgi:uncharacterized BrkB/YihY/UPF0761 family membrane protein
MKRPLVTTVVILVLVLVFHLSALSNFWYWKYWWFDILMHIAGGYVILLLIIIGWERYLRAHSGSLKRAIITALFGVLLVAVGWEVFEYKAGVTFLDDNYYVDTALDIFMGVLGAILGARQMFTYFKKNE